jgi:type IV secretory pathway TraG/TraD family ATPase VirD4
MSQRKPKARLGFNSLLQISFTINRMIEIWRLNQGRKRSFLEAQKAKAQIEAGEVSGKLQNSNLGTFEDAVNLGLIKKEGEVLGGVYLGHFHRHPLFMPKDHHVTICGMAGSMKSLSIVIPNIITLGLGGESTMFFNMKDNELYNAVHKGRAKIDGVAVIHIDHFIENDPLPVCINLLFDLIEQARNGHMIVDDCFERVEMLFAQCQHEGANSWISDDAKKITHVLLIFWATENPDRCFLGAFWDFSTLSHEEFGNEFLAMTESKTGNSFVAMQAAKIYDQYGREHSDQFEWVMDSFQKAFRIFGRGGVLYNKTRFNHYDPANLAKELSCLSINFPAKFNDSHAQYPVLMSAYIIKRIAQVKDRRHRVAFCLDEFGNIPRIPSMAQALRLYREISNGLGIRIITVVQDREAFAKYKSEGGYKVFEENSVCMTWGVSGSHAKEISDKAGFKSVSIATASHNAGVSADGGGQGMGEQVTPVLPVSEIAQNFQGRAVLDLKEKIFIVDRLPYWEINFVKDYIEG